VKYRADIDGLRAIAVAAVVLFHAGFPIFSGGYVGVDVFFVISGYLITGLIAAEIRDGGFSLLTFYERRVRRIFPALFTVLIASCLIAFGLFLPGTFEDFGTSVVATVFFAANFLFWRDTGYFAAPPDEKPLLHTWSLAVEEQFYLVWPLLLLVLRFARPRAWTLLLLAGSFAASAWAVNRHPDAAFYLPHLRAWELLLGAVLAIGPMPTINRAWLRELCALVGLGMILWSVLFYTEQTTFPGPAALLPCLGTALLIHCGTGREVATINRALSWKPIVAVGLISYSLYLWHWPLMVFARYSVPGEPSQLVMVGIVALSIVLAALSWRFVEQPFRGRRGILRRPALFRAAGAASVALLTAGGIMMYTGGLPQRLPSEVVTLAAGRNDFAPDRSRCHSIDPVKARDGGLCVIGPEGQKPSFLLWGDSHASVLQPAFQAIATDAGVAGWHASHSACPPLVGLVRPQRPKCRWFNDVILRLIPKNDIDTVFLAARWAGYRRPALERYLPETIRTLTELGVTVVLIEPVPELWHAGPRDLALAVLFGRPMEPLSTRKSDHEHRMAEVRRLFDRMEAEFGAIRIDPAATLCPAALCRVTDAGRSLYADSHHLSQVGALLLAESLAPAFSEAINTNAHH
jgi:peptidoglycan/LPS O-acetylase OafA/YrhL